MGLTGPDFLLNRPSFSEQFGLQQRQQQQQQQQQARLPTGSTGGFLPNSSAAMGLPQQQQPQPGNFGGTATAVAAAYAAQQQQQQAAQSERAQAVELRARLAHALENPHLYPGLNLGKVQAQLLAQQQHQHQHSGPRSSTGSNGRTPPLPPNSLIMQQQQAFEAEMRMKQAAANIIAASQGMQGRVNLQGLNGGAPPPPLTAGRGAPSPAPPPPLPMQQKQAHHLQALDRLKETASAREVLKAKEMAGQYQRQQLQQSEMLRRMLLYQQQLEQQQQQAGGAQASTVKQQQLQEALAKQDVLAQASARKAAEANHNAAVQSLMAMRGFNPAQVRPSNSTIIAYIHNMHTKCAHTHRCTHTYTRTSVHTLTHAHTRIYIQAQSFLRNVEVLRAVQAQEGGGNGMGGGMVQGKGIDPTERGEQRAASDRALMAAHISRYVLFDYLIC